MRLQNPAVYRKNIKPVLVVFLLLFLCQCLLKLGFYFYNHSLLANTEDSNLLKTIKWSVLYDLLVLFFINAPVIILIGIIPPENKLLHAIIKMVFIIVNTVCIALNLIDIVYFHFHMQRSDGDMLLMSFNSISNALTGKPFISIISFALLVAFIIILNRIYNSLLKKWEIKYQYLLSSILLTILLIVFIALPVGKKLILPAAPLTELKSDELPFVQNSFHTMLYSLYRKKAGAVPVVKYLPAETAASLMPLKKAIVPMNNNAGHKNIVLFIMESVPEDYFDTASRYNIKLPFLDSLLKQSTYFSNAYGFSYTSINGIVSILAGLPSLTDIPLYHSQYLNLKRTSVGDKLRLQGYYSAFFIGDDYDDFGFAKCCNWLGINKYYSKESVPGFKNMEQHSMGLQDEYMFPFMLGEINKYKQPFFSTCYNISTHYPFDLPAKEKELKAKAGYTEPMKSMLYYDKCLKAFFDTASKQDWFNNTVFIFCSDHWAFPDHSNLNVAMGQDFHIPIFIYNPSKPGKKIDTRTASQFDIINTILSIADIKDSIISYGTNLLEPAASNGMRCVFSKKSRDTYYANNGEYILVFNTVTGKTESCFNFIKDPERKTNIINNPLERKTIDSMTILVKAFLQQSSLHYNNLTNP